MKGRTKSKILSILVVISMLVGMFSGLEVFADETTDGRIEVTFREGEGNLAGCIWADVRFYNASCNVLGTKFKYDTDKLKIWNATGNKAIQLAALASKALDIPDEYGVNSEDELAGAWKIVDEGIILQDSDGVAAFELSKCTVDGYTPTFSASAEFVEYNSDTGYIDFKDKGYLAYSICMKLTDTNATINDLNEDIIKFYQNTNDGTDGYDVRNLGAKAQKGGTSQQLVSSKICYPKEVKFLDGKGSDKALDTKQVSVDVINKFTPKPTNTEETGNNEELENKEELENATETQVTGGTTKHGTSYNTLTDMPGEPTNTNKDFAKWCYADNGKDNDFTAGTTEIKDNMTVYAKWNCNLNLDLLGGKCTTVSETGDPIVSNEIKIEPVAEGSNIWAKIQEAIGTSTLSKAGYEKFDNNVTDWLIRTVTQPTEPGGESTPTYDSLTADDTILEHTTVVPKWTASNNTIIFHSDFEKEGGQQEETETQDIKTGEKANLRSNTFERPGYSFKGWSTLSKSTEVTYGDGAEITITYDAEGKASITDLYAVWEAENQKLKFDLNKPENTNYDPKCDMADSYDVPTDTPLSGIDQIKEGDNQLKPTRDGYEFKGWYTNKLCTDEYKLGDTKMPVTGENTAYEDGYTLYAKWEALGQKATIDWNNGKAQGGTESISIFTETSILDGIKTAETGESLTYATVEGYDLNGWARVDLNNKDLVELTENDLMPYVEEGSTFTIYALWKAQPSQKVKENIVSILGEEDLIVDGKVNEKFTKKENYERDGDNYKSAVESLLLYDELIEAGKQNELEGDQIKALDALKETIADVNHTYEEKDRDGNRTGNSITVIKDDLPWNVVIESSTYNATDDKGKELYSFIENKRTEDNRFSPSDAIALVTGITMKKLSLEKKTTSNEIKNNEYNEEVQGAKIIITLNKSNADKYKEYQGFLVNSSESDGSTSYTIGDNVYKWNDEDKKIRIKQVENDKGEVTGEEVSFELVGNDSLPGIIGLVANLDQFTVTFVLNTDLADAAFKATENIYEIDTEQTRFEEKVAKLKQDRTAEILQQNKTIETKLTCQANETITTLNRTAIKNPEGRMFKCWNTKADGSGEDIKSGTEYTPTGSTSLYAKWTIPGECTSDDQVNGDDLSVILQYYNQYGNNLSADIDNSGKVDGDDLSIVLEYYNKKLKNGEIIKLY